MTDEADRRALAIGIVGPGLVGKTLIAQLAEQVRTDFGHSTILCSYRVRKPSFLLRCML